MFTHINPLNKPTATVEILIIVIVAYILGYVTHWMVSLLVGGDAFDIEDEEVSFEPDDLQAIVGVTSKIEQILNEHDIYTYEDLAAKKKKELKQILDRSGARYRAHNPTPWISQALLAKNGDWDALARLQSRLRKKK